MTVAIQQLSWSFSVPRTKYASFFAFFQLCLDHRILADDITIYASCNASNFHYTLLNVQLCISYVVDWFTSNRFKINVEKLLLFCVVPSVLARMSALIKICGCDLPVLSQVKLLGVIFIVPYVLMTKLLL